MHYYGNPKTSFRNHQKKKKKKKKKAAHNPTLSITILSKEENWKLDGFIPSSLFQSNRWDLDKLLKQIVIHIIICKLISDLRGLF